MSKYERFLIYPLLIVAIVYGLIGTPGIQAKQGVEVFDRIEAKEIVIKNNNGIEVVSIYSNSVKGGGISTYNKDGGLGTVMATGDEGGGISTFNKDGEMGTVMATGDEGGEVSTFK